MEAIIVQQAKILEPRTVPEYMNEVTRYKQAADPKTHGRNVGYKAKPPLPTYRRTRELIISPEQLLLPEGSKPYASFEPIPENLVSMEEFRRIASGAAMGKALYSYAIEYLRPLNISSISPIRGAINRSIPREVWNLDRLRKNLEAIASTQPEFYARIHPREAVGADKARIRMSYSSNDDDLGPDYNRRAIAISARFDNPELAKIGIRPLNALFQEMLFEDALFFGILPKKIMDLYIRSDDYISALWGYERGLTNVKPDFDENVYRQMTKEAATMHLSFLLPHLQRLGIAPHTVAYYDNRSNLNYTIPVASFGEVADLLSRGYYDGSDIPNIIGAFNGREIELDFRQWKWGPRLGRFALRIANKSQDGTLEDILSKTTPH